MYSFHEPVPHVAQGTPVESYDLCALAERLRRDNPSKPGQELELAAALDWAAKQVATVEDKLGACVLAIGMGAPELRSGMRGWCCEYVAVLALVKQHSHLNLLFDATTVLLEHLGFKFLIEHESNEKFLARLTAWVQKQCKVSPPVTESRDAAPPGPGGPEEANPES